MRIDVIISGGPELANAANMFATRLEQEVVPAWIDDTGNMLIKLMKNRMHQVTGKMKSSTILKKVGPLQSIVEVPVPYAMAENRRPGSKLSEGTPHRFLEPSVEETMGKQTPQFLAQLLMLAHSTFGISKPATFSMV